MNSSQVRLEVAKNIIIADGSFRVNSSRHRSRVMITSGYGEVTRNHPSYFRSCSNFHFTRGFKLGISGFHYITGTSSEASCQLLYCDDNNHFLYMFLQLFAMHNPRLQAPSDYISDVFDSLDPWPQQYSCSFRFK